MAMVSGDALELKEGDEARGRGWGCVTSPESAVSSSGGSGLRRGIPGAWRHNAEGEKGENGEEREGVL
jgi:hypothetical protein